MTHGTISQATAPPTMVAVDHSIFSFDSKAVGKKEKIPGATRFLAGPKVAYVCIQRKQERLGKGWEMRITKLQVRK